MTDPLVRGKVKTNDECALSSDGSGQSYVNSDSSDDASNFPALISDQVRGAEGRYAKNIRHHVGPFHHLPHSSHSSLTFPRIFSHMTHVVFY